MKNLILAMAIAFIALQFSACDFDEGSTPEFTATPILLFNLRYEENGDKPLKLRKPTLASDRGNDTHQGDLFGLQKYVSTYGNTGYQYTDRTAAVDDFVATIKTDGSTKNTFNTYLFVYDFEPGEAKGTEREITISFEDIFVTNSSTGAEDSLATNGTSLDGVTKWTLDKFTKTFTIKKGYAYKIYYEQEDDGTTGPKITVEEEEQVAEVTYDGGDAPPIADIISKFLK